MNSKQKKTLATVFRNPVSATVAWADVESLLISAGAQVIEAKGSGVKFTAKGVVLSVHRPHPEKIAKRYQVRLAREFLEKIGVRP